MRVAVDVGTDVGVNLGVATGAGLMLDPAVGAGKRQGVGLMSGLALVRVGYRPRAHSIRRNKSNVLAPSSLALSDFCHENIGPDIFILRGARGNEHSRFPDQTNFPKHRTL